MYVIISMKEYYDKVQKKKRNCKRGEIDLFFMLFFTCSRFFCQSRYDCIALTKTWLHDGVHSVKILYDNYNVYRKDKIKSKLEKEGEVES